MNAKVITALIETAASAIAVTSTLITVLSLLPKVIKEWKLLFRAKKRVQTDAPFARWSRFLDKKVKERTATPWEFPPERPKITRHAVPLNNEKDYS